MTSDPQLLLHEAQAGETAALGRLLERYQRYLLLLATVQIGKRLQGKVDPADLVQETYLEAHRNFGNFRGTTELEFASWLRAIMAGNLADLMRRYLGTKARDIRLEREMRAAVDCSSVLLDRGFFAPGSSPSQQAVRREQGALLADALAALPQHYREVLIMRHLEGLTFPEIAQRMERSLDSVEKLWMRALVHLRQLMGGGT